MRDRFLVLAADAALLAGKTDEAERLRLRLLKVNPHHMLKPYPSFAQALKAPDVLTYVKDLRVNYPADVAEDLLRTLQADEKHAAAAPVEGLALSPCRWPRSRNMSCSSTRSRRNPTWPRPGRRRAAAPSTRRRRPSRCKSRPVPFPPDRPRLARNPSAPPAPARPPGGRPGGRPPTSGDGTAGAHFLDGGPAVLAGPGDRRGPGRLHVAAAVRAAGMVAVRKGIFQIINC